MKALIIILGIIYILSPVDLWPGILDDIACIILMIYACGKVGINPYSGSNSKESSDHSTDYSSNWYDERQQY